MVEEFLAAAPIPTYHSSNVGARHSAAARAGPVRPPTRPGAAASVPGHEHVAVGRDRRQLSRLARRPWSLSASSTASPSATPHSDVAAPHPRHPREHHVARRAARRRRADQGGVGEPRGGRRRVGPRRRARSPSVTASAAATAVGSSDPEYDEPVDLAALHDPALAGSRRSGTVGPATGARAGRRSSPAPAHRREAEHGHDRDGDRLECEERDPGPRARPFDRGGLRLLEHLPGPGGAVLGTRALQTRRWRRGGSRPRRRPVRAARRTGCRARSGRRRPRAQAPSRGRRQRRSRPRPRRSGRRSRPHRRSARRPARPA